MGAKAANQPERRPYLAGGEFVVDNDTLRIWFRGRRLDVSMRQHRLIEMFLNHAGIPLTRKQIMAEIWGTETKSDIRSVDAEIIRLRRAIGEDPSRGPIRTVRGVGFVFSPDGAGAAS
jgi:DNA-binding response OmpR family regulator